MSLGEFCVNVFPSPAPRKALVLAIRLSLAAALVLAPTLAAQTPTPPPAAPQASASDAAWDRLNHLARYGTHTELRIETPTGILHCHLEGVGPDGLTCMPHELNAALVRVILRPQPDLIPRQDIRNIRVGGRELSTLIGAGIGAGIGFGFGAQGTAPHGTGEFIGALGVGLIGGFFGHLFPTRGHLIYTAP